MLIRNSELNPRYIDPFESIASILVFSPGLETSLGLLIDPEVSLFETNSDKDASMVGAREDHGRMTAAFTEHNLNVVDMRQVVSMALADKFDISELFPTRESFLNEIKRRAELYRSRHEDKISRDMDLAVSEFEQLLDIDIKQYGFDQALAINAVLTRCIDLDGRPQLFDPMTPPVCNQMFMRDPFHTTGTTIGMHRMYSDTRKPESNVVRMGFEKLGLVYSNDTALAENATIEGGDVLTVDIGNQLYAMIGQAQRTSKEGAIAWFTLHEKFFKEEQIVPLVIVGPDHDTQDEMHLDTYMTNLAPGVIAHCPHVTKHRLVYRLARLNGNVEYVPVNDSRETNFYNWIEAQASATYEMSREEQLNYSANCVVSADSSDRRQSMVFMTKDTTGGMQKFIAKAGSRSVNLELNNLTKGYGGAHCASNTFHSK